MKTIWIFTNAFVVVGTLVCMSYLYYACRPASRGRFPWFSLSVIGLTALITGLQFAYPELLTALQRDGDAVRAGEWWRMVTALFVQPGGIGQCVANGILIVAFMPAAERLYGKNVLLVYFGSGLVGQIMNFVWDLGSGGSSTAIFGLMGSLLICIIRHRIMLLMPFVLIAGAVLLTSVVMVASRDGHGVGLITGALIGGFLPSISMAFRVRTTGPMRAEEGTSPSQWRCPSRRSVC